MLENYGERWTIEHDKVLQSMKRDGFPIEEIADRLGRTVTSCKTRMTYLRYGSYSKLRQRGAIPSKRKFKIVELSDEMTARVVEMYDEQLYKMSAIARILDLPYYYVRNAIIRSGVDLDKQRLPQVLDREELKRIVESGEYTKNGVANYFGVTMYALEMNMAIYRIDDTNLKPNERNNWTTREVEQLKNMVSQNMSYWRIGLALSRTSTSCRTKARSLGLSNAQNENKLGGMVAEREDGVLLKFWTDEEIEELERLYASGETISEIARRLKRSYHSVGNKVQNEGLYDKYADKRESVHHRAMKILKERGLR